MYILIKNAILTLSLFSALILRENINLFSIKKILVNFLVKNCHTKIHESNLMHFQGEMVHFSLETRR